MSQTTDFTGYAFGSYDVQTHQFLSEQQPTNSDTIAVTFSGTLTPGSSFTETDTTTGALLGYSFVYVGEYDGSILGQNLQGDYYLFGPASAASSGTVIPISTDAYPPCYLRGTRIATDRGDIAVENLAIGDLVITSAGGARPVVWLGHSTFDTTSHSDPEAVWPIVVRADAFGPGLPVRDLWLSPGHNLAIDGCLMPACVLINGATVQQIRAPRADYWHVELDAHDVILAERLPAESYLDTGNRAVFENAAAAVGIRPDIAPKHWTETCLPLVFDGPPVVRAKAALLAQARAIGHTITHDDDLHIRADGRRIDPERIASDRVVFLLPSGCEDIALRTRRFVPVHMDPSSGDDRTLGVCVARLSINGLDIPLSDGAALADGWHQLEHDAIGSPQRWTTDHTRLPPGARLVVIFIAGLSYYWSETRSSLALAAG